MIDSDLNELFREIDKLGFYLVKKRWPLDEVDLFYDFCYSVIVKLQNCEYDFQVSINQIETAFRLMVYGE